jgi:hypothetical protein
MYQIVQRHVTEATNLDNLWIFLEIFYYVVDCKNTEISNLRFCILSYTGFT